MAPDSALPDVVTDALASDAPTVHDASVGFFPYPFSTERPAPLTWTHHPKRSCVACGETALAFSDLCHTCHIEATMTPDELAEARGTR